MTQEEKELLLKNLCARLPYGVKIEIDGYYSHILKGIDGDTISTDRGINYPLRLVKPYLRLMSSMTEEEEKEFNKVVYDSIDIDNISPCVCVANWLYSKCFDVHGLIPKGLALEASEGMYKNI